MTIEIHFKVTDDRTELLPMGVYRRLDSDPDAQIYFVAHFLVDDNGAHVLRYDDDGIYTGGKTAAFEVLDRLPLRKIRDLVAALQGDVEEAAVPKA